MKKFLLGLLLTAGMAWGAGAQTVASITYADGSSSDYTIQTDGGFYFDSAVLIIRESRISSDERIPVDSIQQVTLRSEATQSIEEAETVSMRLFPNPATQQVQVSLPDNETHTLLVYSISGQRLMEVPVRNGQTVNVGHLAKGVYIARADQYIVKLIKQ